MAVDIIGINAPKDGPYLVSQASATLTNETVISNSSQLAAIISDETGTGSLVFASSPSLTTPNIGTPSAGTLTNCTGLPISTGVSGLGSNVATFLATPSSANLASALTDETGSGAVVFATSPTLVTPAIGTPSSGTLTNCSGLPITGLASGTSANLASVISDETGSGALVFANTPTLVTPVLGTPTSGTLTNCTGLPITGLASGTSANLASVISDETGTGALVFANTPTLVTPDIGAATGTSLSLGGAAVPTVSSTSTLTNKEIVARVDTKVSEAAAEIEADNYDVYEQTAAAANITFSFTGTPTDGQKVIIRIKDDGTSRTLTWTPFTAVGVTLPAATTAGKWLYAGATYNSGAAAWHVIALSQEA